MLMGAMHAALLPRAVLVVVVLLLLLLLLQGL
jgi:hypothetical protein